MNIILDKKWGTSWSILSCYRLAGPTNLGCRGWLQSSLGSGQWERWAVRAFNLCILKCTIGKLKGFNPTEQTVEVIPQDLIIKFSKQKAVNV